MEENIIAGEIPSTFYRYGPDTIVVLHEVTLGDLLVSTLLLVLVVFIVISTIVRR